MLLRPRTALAVVLCASLLAPLPGGIRPSEARSVTRLAKVTLSPAHPPVRVQVTEPPRPRLTMPPAATIKPKTVAATRSTNSRYVPGPPMFRPTEIDGAIKAAARTACAGIRSTPRRPSSAALGAAPRRACPARSPQARSLGVARQSIPSDPNASGTGINPWWRYQEENIPGGGHLMVNVGTGNFLIQDDDMAVPHKGIALAFRRTYNSQACTTSTAAMFTPTRACTGTAGPTRSTRTW